MTAYDPTAPRFAEVVPNRLWALGGAISAEQPRSWLAPQSRGWLPVRCYALRDGEHFVLIDTGLVGHADSIRSGLAELMAGTRQRHILLTRREPDTMLNLPWIVREFAINSVRCCGPIDPFDLVERLDEAHTASDISAAFGISVDFLEPDSTTYYDETSLTIMRPPIRILATDWMFESTTGTLFCSDLWAFVTQPSPGGTGIERRDGPPLSVGALTAHLVAKFDWLSGIDTAPIIKQLVAVLGRYRVQRLAPSYGCVIEGEDLVGIVVERTIEALRQIEGLPRLQPLGDFGWLPRQT